MVGAARDPPADNCPLYWGQNENLIMQNLIIHQ